MGKFLQAVESHRGRDQAQPGEARKSGIGAGPVKNSLAFTPYIRYNAAHLRLSEQRAIKRLFFVILSAAKNLSFKAAEIRNEAALRSE